MLASSSFGEEGKAVRAGNLGNIWEFCGPHPQLVVPDVQITHHQVTERNIVSITQLGLGSG